MPARVFISHSHEEKELARAWQELIGAVTAGAIEVWLSSDVTPGGGMKLGDEWRARIYGELAKATHVLAVVTPKSLARPWILWESGVATGISRERKLVPVVFSMPLGDLTGPMSSYQAYAAEDERHVREVCEKLALDAGLKPRTNLWGGPIDEYLEAVRKFSPPRPISSEEIDRWLLRLTRLRDDGREVEIPQIVEQLYASLGGEHRPVDGRIHDLVSEVCLGLEQFARALEEVGRGLALSSDDTILTHRRILCLLELKNFESAKAEIERFYEHLPHAAEWAEFAGLEGRLYRDLHRLDGDRDSIERAVAAYRRAFDSDPSQHYPGGQAIAMALLAGDEATIDDLLPKVIALSEAQAAPTDASYWSDFTLGEMHLIDRDVDAAERAYARGLQRRAAPSLRDRDTALAGLRRTAEKRGLDVSRIEALFPPPGE